MQRNDELRIKCHVLMMKGKSIFQQIAVFYKLIRSLGDQLWKGIKFKVKLTLKMHQNKFATSGHTAHNELKTAFALQNYTPESCVQMDLESSVTRLGYLWKVLCQIFLPK